MNTGWAHKEDGTAWMPWDVFSELQPMEEEISEEEQQRNMEGIIGMFRMIAARQKAADGT